MLDAALYRRFDDVIEYSLPDSEIAKRILENRLSTFKTKGIDWSAAVAVGAGLSQAEFALAAEGAAKQALLADRETVTAEDLSSAIAERQAAVRR